MNIVRAFAQYLQDTGVATLGQDLFISRAPSSLQAQSRLFWLKAAGGSLISRSVNGNSRRLQTIEIYLRDLKAESVYEDLEKLADDLNCNGCLVLPDYTIEAIETVGPWADQDLDDEERLVGLLQINLTIHKEC